MSYIESLSAINVYRKDSGFDKWYCIFFISHVKETNGSMTKKKL